MWFSQKFFKKAIILLIIVLNIAFVFKRFILNTSPKEDLPNKTGQKIKIITTLFPLYDFAKNIGQDKVEVSLLLLPGVDAHAFEPKPSDILLINQADLFVYTGQIMEPWAKDLIAGLNNPKLTIIDTSQNINLLYNTFHEYEEISASQNNQNSPTTQKPQERLSPDPHFWLDFNNASQMTEEILQGLINVDPQNADFYTKNTQTYQTKLTALNQEYANSLTLCKNKTVIYSGHSAFLYLANKYNLNFQALYGPNNESEPTIADLTQLIKLIKDKQITYIYVDKLTNPKITELLTSQTQAKTLTLNTGANLSKDDFNQGVSFLNIMQDNLANLKQGLNCN